MTKKSPPATKRQWTGDTDTELMKLLKAGATTREAAAKLGWGTTTIRKHARRLGHSFPEQTRNVAAAQEAAQVNAAVRRQARLEALADNYLGDAEHLRKRIYDEMRYSLSTARDGVEHWYETEPIPADQLKLVQASGVALEKALKVIDRNTDTGKQEAFSLLDGLAAQLGITAPESDAKP